MVLFAHSTLEVPFSAVSPEVNQGNELRAAEGTWV
jgi:hypothetical protein